MAHVLRPGFRSEDTYLQLELFAGQAGILDGIRQIERIRRCAAKHRRTEIMHQGDLFLRISARHRDDGSTDILSTGMRPQSAGEQSVSVGDVEEVGTARTVGREGARQAFGPCREVLARIPYDRRLTGRARRGMDTHDLAHGDGAKPERIVVAQVVLGRER